MAAPPEHIHQTETPPLLLLHRLPTFKLPIFTFLRTKYTLLDPHADPPDPSFTTRSKVARLILCAGPTPLTTDDLDRYPSVECIIGSSAGVNHIDLTTCRSRGIRVTSAGDAFSDDVADYAVALAIDVSRKISAGNRFVRAGSWPCTEFPLGSKLCRKRVGIIGLGSIGSRVARRFEAFGCTIAYNSRKKKTDLFYPFYATVTDLASNSDVLVVCCALTDETLHVVNKDVMKALGKEGIIINVGRGEVVDEKELVEFLVRGDICGAGLDVFENEPRVPEELWKLDNVVLSAHRAVLTPESFAALEELLISNIEAFFDSKPLKAQIELDS